MKELTDKKELKQTNGLEPMHKIGRAQRLNSSHTVISYAVFCLKKKKKTKKKKNKKNKKKK